MNFMLGSYYTGLINILGEEAEGDASIREVISKGMESIIIFSFSVYL